MSTEQNKKLAIELFARFTASDIAGVLDTMTEDATWLIPGKPDASPAAGLYTKEKISGLFFDSHHGSVRFTWEMVNAGDGAIRSVGLEFLLLVGDGRIREDYQFIEPGA